MTVCNERPPEGHPLRSWGVACYLPADHLSYEEPHSWDIDAAVVRHEILAGAMDRLRAAFPERPIARFDNGIPHPIVVYEVDAETGERVSDRPYRTWDLRAGPWLMVTFKDGGEYAIWKVTGDIYEVDEHGAVGEDPTIPNPDRKGL